MQENKLLGDHLQEKKKDRFITEIRKNFWLYMLAVPAILYAIVFKYIPLVGISIAFQDFNPIKGLFGSQFIGLDNFKYFFRGSQWLQITINTLWLNILFIVTGTIAAVSLAIILVELGKNIFVKFNQSVMIFPNFISWVVVAMFVQAFIGSDGGYINRWIQALGGTPISFYTEARAWPVIFVVVRIWKGAGFGAIIYMATILGIDTGMYEAARIDGASRMQAIFRITIPMLKETVILLTILGIGTIFYGDFGMIYTMVGDNSVLFSTTDVIDTYVFRSIRTSGSMGMSAAVGLYQSLIGFLLVIFSNQMAKKYSPDAAIF
ncbi:MAG: ABC transporter permease subunit [Bacillota bacterium]|nr:ABC transporter permease subunit [Bacillota bacterium]